MILFFGCSYTYGKVPKQPEHLHTYPSIIQQETGLPVINFGIWGGSNNFSDFLISRALTRFSPTFVFFQTTFPTRNFITNRSGDLDDFKFSDFLEKPTGSDNYITFNQKSIKKQFSHFTPTTPNGDWRWYYEKFLDDRIDLGGVQASNSALYRLKDTPHYAFEMYTHGLYGLDDKRVLFDPSDWCDEGKHLSHSGNIKLANDLLKYIK
jgi:hypothetical protein